MIHNADTYISNEIPSTEFGCAVPTHFNRHEEQMKSKQNHKLDNIENILLLFIEIE